MYNTEFSKEDFRDHLKTIKFQMIFWQQIDDIHDITKYNKTFFFLSIFVLLFISLYFRLVKFYEFYLSLKKNSNLLHSMMKQIVQKLHLFVNKLKILSTILCCIREKIKQGDVGFWKFDCVPYKSMTATITSQGCRAHRMPCSAHIIFPC